MYIIATTVFTEGFILVCFLLHYPKRKSLCGPGSPGYETEVSVSGVADGDQEGEELWGGKHGRDGTSAHVQTGELLFFPPPRQVLKPPWTLGFLL